MKKVPRSKPSARRSLFARWFTTTTSVHGSADTISILIEKKAPPEDIWSDAVAKVRSHYQSAATISKICKNLGYRAASNKLRASVPTGLRAQSGELGEILASEYLNEQSGPKVVVKRLRFKDGREMPLRGDDIIACSYASPDGLRLIKGECKSSKSLTMATLLEAETKLQENGGRPSDLSGGFIANQVQRSDPALSEALNSYLYAETSAASLEHFVGIFTQHEPKRLFPTFLKRSGIHNIPRHLLAIVVKQHKPTIERIYKLVTNDIAPGDTIDK